MTITETQEHERIVGVFSKKKVLHLGAGATKRKQIQKAYYYARELDDGVIEIQMVNANFVPSGPVKKITREFLLEELEPEPEYFIKSVQPKMRELSKTVARADRYRSRGETFSAEMEYVNALAIDEDHIRANFGVGLCYLSRGETTKANDIFKRLVRLEESFDPEHKHLFNDFGISLRRSKMYDQALDYYLRAVKLAGDDENLHLNLARLYLEMNQVDDCIHAMEKSLELNPVQSEAIKLRNFLEKKGWYKRSA